MAECCVVMYKKTVVNKPDFMYLKTQLIFEDGGEELEIDAVIFKSLVVRAIGILFGEVGRSVNVDVLKYSSKSKEAILRIPAEALVRVQSSLSLLGSYLDRNCAFHTLQVSPHLISLAVNSRNIDN